MTSSRFTLTQYLDYIKPLFVKELDTIVLRQEKLSSKPSKLMPRKEENISALLVGRMVDILTRTQLLSEKRKTFSLRDALCDVNPRAAQLGRNVALQKENELLGTLTDINRDTVIVLHRILHGLSHWQMKKRPRCTKPNRKVVNNILYMVNISSDYFRTQPDLDSGRTLKAECFNKLWPTKIDYVTETGLWDMVVSEYPPTGQSLLKLIAYDILAFDTPEYKNREFMEVGIVNPRLEYRYWLPCNQFPVDLYENLQYLLHNKHMGDFA